MIDWVSRKIKRRTFYRNTYAILFLLRQESSLWYDVDDEMTFSGDHGGSGSGLSTDDTSNTPTRDRHRSIIPLLLHSGHFLIVWPGGVMVRVSAGFKYVEALGRIIII